MISSSIVRASDHLKKLHTLNLKGFLIEYNKFKSWNKNSYMIYSFRKGIVGQKI